MALGLIAGTERIQDRRIEDLGLHCGHTGGRFELGSAMDCRREFPGAAVLISSEVERDV